jgi:hypothetical protein
MELEQKSPKKPNFLLVVLLSAGSILLIFLIALAAVGFDGKRLLHFGTSRSTKSELVMPLQKLPLTASLRAG